MEKLLIPAATPMALVRLQAIQHLRATSSKRVLRETAWPRGHVALQALALVMLAAVYLVGPDGLMPEGAVLGGALSLVAGIATCAMLVRQRGRVVRAPFEQSIADVQNRSLCPLQVLNARFEPSPLALEALQGSFDRAAEPTLKAAPLPR